mmetsp:Transcript_4933/g.14291  ORF Transcript_4933/g.14291 Transcript_4933/m.14291 type:complete len:303 (-) Transcript_4933:1623-2531(-)
MYGVGGVGFGCNIGVGCGGGIRPAVAGVGLYTRNPGGGTAADVGTGGLDELDKVRLSPLPNDDTVLSSSPNPYGETLNGVRRFISDVMELLDDVWLDTANCECCGGVCCCGCCGVTVAFTLDSLAGAGDAAVGIAFGFIFVGTRGFVTAAATVAIGFGGVGMIVVRCGRGAGGTFFFTAKAAVATAGCDAMLARWRACSRLFHSRFRRRASSRFIANLAAASSSFSLRDCCCLFDPDAAAVGTVTAGGGEGCCRGGSLSLDFLITSNCSVLSAVVVVDVLSVGVVATGGVGGVSAALLVSSV